MTAKGRHLKATQLSTVSPEPVEWMWPDRIPQGKLVVIGGDPDPIRCFGNRDLDGLPHKRQLSRRGNPTAGPQSAEAGSSVECGSDFLGRRVAYVSEGELFVPSADESHHTIGGHKMPAVPIDRPTQEVLSLPAAAKRLPISEAKLREMARNAVVPSTKLGRKYYLSVSDIKAHPVLGLLWR